MQMFVSNNSEAVPPVTSNAKQRLVIHQRSRLRSLTALGLGDGKLFGYRCGSRLTNYSRTNYLPGPVSESS